MGRLNLNFSLAIVLLFTFCNSSFSQSKENKQQALIDSLPKETIVVYVNANIVLSGQTLYYNLFCTTHNGHAAISNIVYVELVGQNKTIVFKHKLNLETNKASGDYFLPTNLKTGHYKLIAYTNLTLNGLNDTYAQQDIYVINPYLDASDNNLKSKFNDDEGYIELYKNQNVNMVRIEEGFGLKIATDSYEYPKRSKVVLEIQNKFNQINFGSYTISIKKMDSVVVKTIHADRVTSSRIKKAFVLPELRGELISGKVMDKRTNLPAKEQTVSLSIPGKDYVFKSTKTNKDGEFYFNIFENFSIENAWIQVIDENREDFQISIAEKEFDHYDDIKLYPLNIDSNLRPYITENSIFNQVESAYYNVKRDSLLRQDANTCFYGKSTVKYVLDDYTRFPTVRETFVEIVQKAAIRTHKDTYRFLVYDNANEDQSLYDIKPLLLMDGLQIQDENIVVDFNPKEIESISIVVGIYISGSTIYNGIIDIKSKTYTALNLSGDYVEKINIQQPFPKKIYFTPDYTADKGRTPDYRTQLLWRSNVDLKSELKTIEFYTSDVSGFYEIKINGLTNNGKVIHLNGFFKVKDN